MSHFIFTTHDELLYVLEGTGRMRIGESYYDFKPGIILYVPQDTIHGGVINGELRTVSVYTPKFDIRNPDRVFVDEQGNPLGMDD